MTVLGIECSTSRGGLALWENGEVIWETNFTGDRAHNARIFAPLEEALERCRRRIDRIAVGIGPGSYGGVRVGIAVANGLALALDAPAAGLSSLEAIAEAEHFAVIGDARRRSFFLATIRGGRLTGEPDLLSETELTDQLDRLNRDGVPVFTSDPKLAGYHPVAALAYPEARRLAESVAAFSAEDFLRESAKPLQPHYLRAPYITTPGK